MNPYGPTALEEEYKLRCDTPSDINEHLPLLRQLASECDHVTEFGYRWGNGSTVAFLAAQPKVLVSWDLDSKLVVSQRTADLIALQGHTSFQPRTGNTLELITEPTDLLLIDTLHTARQLKAELERHVEPGVQAHLAQERGPCWCSVRRYLIFHDTTAFGVVGEDGSEPGLRMAIRWFQKEFAFPLWRLTHDLSNNSGLVVLSHV